MQDKSWMLYLPVALMVIGAIAMFNGESPSANTPAPSAVAAGAKISPATQPQDQDQGERVYLFKTDGLSCGSCEAKITDALSRTDGVGGIIIDLNRGLMAVSASGASPQIVEKVVTDLGYPTRYLNDLAAMPTRASTGGSQSGCGCGSSGGCGV